MERPRVVKLAAAAAAVHAAWCVAASVAAAGARPGSRMEVLAAAPAAAWLALSAALSAATALGLAAGLRARPPEPGDVESPATPVKSPPKPAEVAAGDISDAFRLALFRYLAKAEVRELTQSQEDLVEAHLTHLVTYARKVAHTIMYAQRDAAVPKPPQKLPAKHGLASLPPVRPKPKPRAPPGLGDPSTGISAAPLDEQAFPEIAPPEVRDDAAWLGDIEAPRAPSALALLGAALQDERKQPGATDLLKRLQDRPGPGCCAPTPWAKLQHEWGPEQEEAARNDPELARERRAYPRTPVRGAPRQPDEWRPPAAEEPRYVSITTDEVRGWLHEAASTADLAGAAPAR